jgi:hypothetical protein
MIERDRVAHLREIVYVCVCVVSQCVCVCASVCACSLNHSPSLCVDPSELTIQLGHIIHVFRKEDEVWYGESDGCIGSFPHAALQRRRRTKSFHIGRTNRTVRGKRAKAGESVATKTLPTGFTPKKAEVSA